jgi:hypothetical protein
MFGLRRKISLVVILALTALVAQAQEAQNAAPAKSVKKVVITPATVEAEVGQQLKFTAVGLDADDKPTDQKPMIWFAVPSDQAVADPASGTVTLFNPGEVRVGTVVGGKTAYARITVKPARLTRIDLAAPSAPVIVGGTAQMMATARIASGDPRRDVIFAWHSSNPSVAAIDAAGVVTGVAPGKAKLTATAEGASGAIEIEVVKSSVRSLVIEPRTAQARTGDVIRFKAQAKDGSGKTLNAAVRWAVSGADALIESDGAFVAERPGTYVVTAASGEQAAVASIVVTPRNVEREIELVGRIPFREIQASEQWLFGNYAYVSTIWDQVQVYDITDPASPKLTDTIKVDARIVNDVSVTPDGKIGVLTREGASSRKNGIVFLDTSDPAHPKIISEYTETVTGGVHSAFIDGHYVYLTDDATGSMRVIDFKDVKNPREVARWQVEREIYNQLQTSAGAPGRYLHDVQVKDGLAYLAYWRDGLVILDVGAGIKGGSPEKPALVSQLRFNHHELYGDGWIAGTHEVYRYKNYVFVGDEVFPAEFNIYDKARVPARGIVHVVDVSDITSPRKVAEYPVPEGGAHNIWVKDDVLAMGYYGGGGRVLDVSGELRGDLYRQGREMARVWTGDPQGFRPNITFTWGARHHNGLIFFNDINSGIWITKLGKPRQKGSTTSPGY